MIGFSVPCRLPWAAGFPLGNNPSTDGMMTRFDRDMFHDYVIAHGFGPPTEEGYALGFSLIAGGDDMSTAATEVVARGLTHSDDGEG